MAEYRLYTLKNGNRIFGVPSVIEFGSDQEAIDKARALLDELDIEIWQGARVVTRLTPADANQDRLPER